MATQEASRPGASNTSTQSNNTIGGTVGSGGTSSGMRAKAGDAAGKLADVAQQAGSQARQAASSLASDATEKAKGFLNQGVTSGADLVGHVAESARSAAASLDQDVPQLAGLVRGAADQIEAFSEDLRSKSVDELVRDASNFTRRQPALVFGLASLAGFLAFRVIKAGSEPATSGVTPAQQGTRSQGEFRGQVHGR